MGGCPRRLVLPGLRRDQGRLRSLWVIRSSGRSFSGRQSREFMKENGMTVHAITATSMMSGKPRVEDTIESLFALQRQSAVDNRAKFTLNARLAVLSRLRATLKRRENDIIGALYPNFRKP